MAGHIKQDTKTKQWYFVMEAGKDSNGKRKRKKQKGFKNQTEAKKALALAIAEYQKEQLIIEDDSITVGDYLDYWLENYAKTNNTAKTFVGYESIVRVHLKPLLGKGKLATLSVTEIQAYYNKKLKELSARTVLHHHRLLTKALNDAMDWEIVSKNVAKSAKPPKPEAVEMLTYTPEQINSLLHAASTSKIFYPIIFTATHTGMRLGELRGLRWKDVNFNNQTIYICQTLVEVKGNDILRNTTKNGNGRPVRMSEALTQFLQKHKEEYTQVKKILGASFNTDDLVFCNSKGKPIRPTDLREAYKSAIKRAGIPDSRFHDLRHSHATILLLKNVHPKIVSERLGHSRISITLDTYSHVIPSLQHEAAIAFDEALN